MLTRTPNLSLRAHRLELQTLLQPQYDFDFNDWERANEFGGGVSYPVCAFRIFAFEFGRSFLAFHATATLYSASGKQIVFLMRLLFLAISSSRL